MCLYYSGRNNAARGPFAAQLAEKCGPKGRENVRPSRPKCYCFVARCFKLMCFSLAH